VEATVMLAACGRIGFDGELARDGAAGDAPSGEPIAFVQASVVGSGDTPAAQISLASVTEGDLLVLPISTRPPGNGVVLDSVVDDRSSTYTILGPFDSGNARAYLAYTLIGPGSAGLTATVTINKPGISFFDLRMEEYSGVTDTLDVAVGSNGPDEGMAAAHLTLTTSMPDDLIVVLAVAAAESSAGSGFTQRTNVDNDITEDELAPTAGAYEVTANISDGMGWDLIAAAFHGK
jgi:hypothetical protein